MHRKHNNYFICFLISTELNLDFSKAIDWVQRTDLTLFSEPVPERTGRYYPISRYLIPTTFSSRILVVGSSLTQIKSTWNLGFYLATIIDVPSVGNAEAVSVPIRLGLNLVSLPQVAAQFTLKVRIPKWHTEMSIAIWEYIGANPDPLADIPLINATVNRIEGKVDIIQT